MEDLDKVRAGDFDALKRNEASRWAANDLIKKGGAPSSGIDFSRIRLDPSVKDKLVSDQVRINQLKEQREKALRDALPELDELEAMTRKWDPNNNVRRSQQTMPGQGNRTFTNGAANILGLQFVPFDVLLV